MKEILKIFDAFYGVIQSGAAWIKASYNSGNNSLLSYGNEEGMDNAIFFSCNF